MTAIPTHYLPPSDVDPSRPAPAIMTAEEVVLYLRINSKHPLKTLDYYRINYGLKAVQLGRHVRYRLEDVQAFVNRLVQDNPR